FDIKKEVMAEDEVEKREYIFPPRTLLNKGSKKAGDSAQSIRQTAQKLQDTLAIFGVEATVTDISQGPTVTRFELQPKLGVKVSRIKNLSDDIKLNLAASEIRIEAPIPGKAAIGIEVPNKEAQPVVFRDLIDTPEYNDFDSNLAFAVGKDIAGKTIVYGIDNFPHLLIAGATGSGKSVCINTLIMSIIYKANPDDVKLIMIDPKVVELSVYNGIPHLLLPVVTDVKKASATLAYAVNEMHERYKKFSEVGVREISGYNREIEKMGEDSFNQKMPHIVIIVDEVADLMLQERKNVEDSIRSLAQLARAAGIHLIIATQRPSVDVITGIIKANMPSRIAFAVSSNVDSRTILDMGGAEELLGKGDMLFFPKGLKKPVRLQGGFISDKEVNSVVEFLKKQGSPSYDAQIEEKIKSCEKSSESSSGGFAGGDGGDGNDELFVDAGFYIIDSDKASIGMLQRKFKMGFNRAARVMDQLADAGVVGPDLGTKPREILMSHEQFENYLEEYGG
ncbi:MAG: DNA translocase FtsK, partial [Lachnospiraceae bacterium]|nr:DNA translocase FtsK [Lachnospiraceae bacterium]